jgi:hypothetical protein
MLPMVSLAPGYRGRREPITTQYWGGSPPPRSSGQNAAYRGLPGFESVLARASQDIQPNIGRIFLQGSHPEAA